MRSFDKKAMGGCNLAVEEVLVGVCLHMIPGDSVIFFFFQVDRGGKAHK